MNGEFAKFLLESEYFKDKIIHSNNSDEINFEATLLSHNVIKKLIYNIRKELYNSLSSSFYIRKIILCYLFRDKHVNNHDLKYIIFSQFDTSSLINLIECFERSKGSQM